MFTIPFLLTCTKSNEVQTSSDINCGENTIKCIPCEAGELDCDGTTLMECKTDGFGFAVRAECESAELCVEGLPQGTCGEALCVAGETQCVGAIMQICASGRHRYDLIVCESEDDCVRGIEVGNCAQVECSEAIDCTGEDTQCRRRVCVEGRCEIANLSSNTACIIGGVNGLCDSNGACRASEECITASDCSGADTECRIRACVQGTCGFANLPLGIACETTSVAGACNGEGSCVASDECIIASDCPGMDTQCRTRACTQGVCGFTNLPNTSVCDIDGIAGNCNGRGSCTVVADCNIATDCPGIDTDCRQRSCVGGMCGLEDFSAGTRCTASNGFAGVCDGDGSCQATQDCLSDGDCSQSSNPCRITRCVNGECVIRDDNDGICTIGGTTGECDRGECICPPRAPNNAVHMILCDGLCIDPYTNTDHCKVCGNSCGENTECDGAAALSSACRCIDDHRRCNGICTSILSDNHCGGCDNICPADSQCGSPSTNRICCICPPGTKRCSAYGSQACLVEGSEEWIAEDCDGNRFNSGCIDPL